MFWNKFAYSIFILQNRFIFSDLLFEDMKVFLAKVIEIHYEAFEQYLLINFNNFENSDEET